MGQGQGHKLETAYLFFQNDLIWQILLKVYFSHQAPKTEIKIFLI